MDAAKAIQAKAQTPQDKLDLNHLKAQAPADKANAATEKANAEAAEQAANSPAPPAQELEEVETLATFPNVMNDRCFQFDLPVLEDRATTAIIRTRLVKLKAELPVPEGYVWKISLKKTQTAERPA